MVAKGRPARVRTAFRIIQTILRMSVTNAKTRMNKDEKSKDTDRVPQFAHLSAAESIRWQDIGRKSWRDKRMETRRVQEEKEVEKEENEDLLRVSVTHRPDVTFHDMER